MGSPVTSSPLVTSNTIVSSKFPVMIKGLGGEAGYRAYAAQSGPHRVPAAASLALAEEWPDSNKINTFEKSVI